MLKRIVTGLGLLSVIGLSVFYLRKFHYAIADAVIVLFALVGTYEMTISLKKGGLSPISAPIAIAAIVIYPATYFLGATGILISVFAGAIISIAILTFSDKYELKDLGATIMPMVYPLAIMMLLTVINHGAGDLLGMFFIFAVVVLTDTMAYFVGVTFKGKKLCPNISPKKTISGAIGGLIGGMLGGVLTWVLFDKFNVFAYMGDATVSLIPDQYAALAAYIGIGLLASVLAEIGDLGASIIKRKIGIKDYGNIFPGHGGVMDRIDSFLFVTPFIYIVLEIMLRAIAV